MTDIIRPFTGPRVGVAVLLRDDAGRLLFMKRKGSAGNGTWSIPGGGVENGESPLDAARRELGEETGVEAFDFRPYPASTYSMHEDSTAWVTLYFTARLSADSPKPRIVEPSKASALEWRYHIGSLAPLFAPLQSFLDDGNDPWTHR